MLLLFSMVTPGITYLFVLIMKPLRVARRRVAETTEAAVTAATVVRSA